MQKTEKKKGSLKQCVNHPLQAPATESPQHPVMMWMPGRFTVLADFILYPRIHSLIYEI